MNWKIDWKKMNWRKLAIEIGMAIAAAAIAGYVLIQAIRRMQDAILECQVPCTMLNAPLDTVGLLKIGFFCIVISLMCVIIVKAVRRYGNQANNGIHS